MIRKALRLVGVLGCSAVAAADPPAKITAGMSPDVVAALLMDNSVRAAPDAVVEDEWNNARIVCTPTNQRGVYYDDPAKVVRRPRLMVEVNFPFASHGITTESGEALDILAEALANPLVEDNRFLLVGHTDAVGSDQANRELSLGRARSVRDYLVAHGIDPSRFKVVGCGEASLLDPGDPNSPINRRVEVVNGG
jgi:outer membrane protein OmpA-like peptidoglycan-associated protein